jgi:TatD DNase family protein
MLIDCHCHLELLKDINGVIERAREKRVGIIVYNSVNLETMRYALKLSEEYDEVKVALGIYPIDALKLGDKELDENIEFIRKNKDKIIAIGEIGIDLKENKDTEKQKINFIKFLKLAKELNLPVIIHSRKAENEVTDILEKENMKNVVMHCFNGNFRLIDKIVSNGWMLTIPTNVTYSEHFQKVIEKVDIKNLLCETDSPFLHFIKGERNNEPANVVESYRKIAEIKKLDLDYVEKIIEENFNRLFSR